MAGCFGWPATCCCCDKTEVTRVLNCLERYGLSVVEGRLHKNGVNEPYHWPAAGYYSRASGW
eukprot:6073854-Amphidinium_carterae.1